MAPLGLLPSSVKEERGPVHLKFKLHQQQLIQNQDPWDKPNRPHQVYTTTFLSFFGKGNSNPLQYSGLENSMDRRAWQAIVHRVTKSQMLLKKLSMQWTRSMMGREMFWRRDSQQLFWEQGIWNLVLVIYLVKKKKDSKTYWGKNKHLLLHCFYGLGVKEWLNWWFSLRCLMRLQAKYWL